MYNKAAKLETACRDKSLLDQIDAATVATELWRSDVLTVSEMHSIRTAANPLGATEMLLRMILACPGVVCDRFMDALRQTGHDDVYARIACIGK